MQNQFNPGQQYPYQQGYGSNLPAGQNLPNPQGYGTNFPAGQQYPYQQGYGQNIPYQQGYGTNLPAGQNLQQQQGFTGGTHDKGTVSGFADTSKNIVRNEAPSQQLPSSNLSHQQHNLGGTNLPANQNIGQGELGTGSTVTGRADLSKNIVRNDAPNQQFTGTLPAGQGFTHQKEMTGDLRDKGTASGFTDTNKNIVRDQAPNQNIQNTLPAGQGFTHQKEVAGDLRDKGTASGFTDTSKNIVRNEEGVTNK